MSTHEEPRYEQSDAKPRPLVLFAIALTVLVIVSLLVSAWIQSGFTRSLAERDVAHPLRELRESPTAPVLQANPVEELEELRLQEKRLLNEYAWIDRPNEVLRIPIQLAIELVAEEGLPVRRPGPGSVDEEER